MDDNHSQDEINSSVSVKYRRRLDRSPDVNFRKLCKEDKILLSTLRGTLEEAKKRIVRLRDENEEKDEIIDEERKLREEAELRLASYLKDMYGDPKVNGELRQRLPRAKKVDPLQGLHDREERNLLEKENESLQASNEDSKPSQKKEVLVQQVVVSQADTGQLQGKPVFPELTKGDTPVTGSCYTQADVLPGTSSHLDVQGGMTQPPTHLQFLPNVSMASYSSMTSSSYQALPTVVKAQTENPQTFMTMGQNISQPLQDTVTISNTSLPSLQSIPSTLSNPSFMSLDPNLTQATPGLYTTVQFPNTEMLNTNQAKLTQFPPTMPQQSQGLGHMAATVASREEHVSHLTRLLAEIATLKRENEQLRSDLKDAKRDLELSKTETKSATDHNLEDIGAMIEETRAAEKAREKAVSQVIQGAEADRNAALKEIDRLRMKSAKKNKIYRSMSSDNLDISLEDADKVSESSLDSGPGGQRSWQRMEELVARQREMMQREMAVVIQQRDAARARVQRLEAKISSMELPQFGGIDSTKLMAKLKIVEQERDMAVTKLRLVTQNNSDALLLHSLQKALLTEDSTNDLSTHRDKDVESNKSSLNGSARLTKQVEDWAKLEAKIAVLDKKSMAQQAENEKLKELVKRQRQKLNALCSGPLLIEGD